MCESYIREIEFGTKGKSYLAISDTYSLTQRNAPDVEYFVTPGNVKKLSETSLLIESGDSRVVLKWSDNLKVQIEEAEIPEASLKRNWSKGLRRIVLSSADDAPLQGKYEMRFEKR